MSVEAEVEVEESTGIVEVSVVTTESANALSSRASASASCSIVLPQMGRILCCLCGVSIIPNDAAMCIPCLSKHSDISELLQLHVPHEAIQCRKCEKWHTGHGDQWVYHELESKGLLNLLLRKIPALQQSQDVRIVDASWIWTEPHSKRVRFVVEIEQSVLDQKITLRSKVKYLFVIRHKQCMDCIHEATDHSWSTMIQVRQAESLTTSGGHVKTKADRQHAHKSRQRGGGGGDGSASSKKHHKKVFYHIESLLTKAGLHNLMSNVHVAKDGFDFYFKSRPQADKVADFLACHFPLRIKYSKKLVSRDSQSNTARHEHTIHIELVPVNKNDLLLTAKQWTGGRQELMLVQRLSSSVHCLQPQTLQTLDIGSQKFFASSGVDGGSSNGGGGGGGSGASAGNSAANGQPKRAQGAGCVLLLHEKHLLPFVVLDVTPINAYHSSQHTHSAHAVDSRGSRARGSKHRKNSQQQQSHIERAASVDSSVVSVAGDVDKRIDKHAKQWQLAEIVVAKESDLGENDTSYTVLSHLGGLLQAGDSVLGYDLAHAVFGARQEAALDALRASNASLPDIVLVKKIVADDDLTKSKNKNKNKNRIPPWRRPPPGEVEGQETLVDGSGVEIDEDEDEELQYDADRSPALASVDEESDGLEDGDDEEQEEGEDDDEDDDFDDWEDEEDDFDEEYSDEEDDDGDYQGLDGLEEVL